MGRGLSALIGEEAVPTRGEAKNARTLPVAFLKPNRFQPRKSFAPEDLNDLDRVDPREGRAAADPGAAGEGRGGRFEIVAGERRWRAAQLAKLHDVPVVVREMSDAESLEIAIIENVQRADLNAIEEAAAYHELMDRFGYTQETDRQGGRQEPLPRRQHAAPADAAGKREGDDARRPADRRPCPHAARCRRSRGACARDYRGRAQCPRG